MIDANETFSGTWPYEPRFFDGSGFRQHYVDEGNGDEVFVCLHGDLDTAHAHLEKQLDRPTDRIAAIQIDFQMIFR